MEKPYRITDEKAYLLGWSDEVRDLLIANRPPRMELVGDWSDLSVFDGIVDSVTTLKISGSLKNGEIKAARGLGVFGALTHLSLVSRVKAGLDVSSLMKLESFAGLWQPELLSLLAGDRIKKVILHAMPGDALASLSENRSITYLWLANPTASSLVGISALRVLDELRITDAKQLQTLHGTQGAALSKIDIESARKLVDFSALRSLPNIRRLRLLFINKEADVKPFSDLESLHWLHIGGKDVPLMDWLSVLRLPRIERIVGWWDPKIASESDMRFAVPEGREIIKFEPMSKAKVRPLDVVIADAA